MAANRQKPELIAIAGPTASGKSELALKIAQRFNGEIIAADSRTIYKSMDIGTAKPSKAEQELVPHWGLDLVEPGQDFSVYQFKKYADKKIIEIQERGKLPILVGGTGLYLDSVIFDFDFVEEAADPEERSELEELSIEQLKSIIKTERYKLPENDNNRRHLIRTIERKGKTGGKRSLKDNTIIIGIMPEPEDLKTRIYSRVDGYFDKGIIKETQGLIRKFGQDSIRKTQGIAYIASSRIINGEISQQEAKHMIQDQEWQYARRQRTWFRRNKFVRWFSSADQANKWITPILNN